MYLTRIYLNPHRRGARQLMRSRQVLHAAVMNCFPPGALEVLECLACCGAWIVLQSREVVLLGRGAPRVRSSSRARFPRIPRTSSRKPDTQPMVECSSATWVFSSIGLRPARGWGVPSLCESDVPGGESGQYAGT